ncbi:hypothetical protein MRX96_006751 [Rhipicephalus microplus]
MNANPRDPRRVAATGKTRSPPHESAPSADVAGDKRFPAASKVNELYAGLRKKDADIYVQRSKQLGQGTSTRAHLVLWHFDQLEVLALADPW